MDLDRYRVMLLVDGLAGAHVGERFVHRYEWEAWGVSHDDAAILANGSEHPDYDEAWDEVLDTAEFTDPDGVAWSLRQDGDLFAITPLPEPDLSLCEDCHAYEQTGDATSFDAWYDEEQANDRLLQVSLGLEQLGTVVYAGEAFDDEFASFPCDCCGSGLGGRRYGYYQQESSNAPVPL